MSRARVPVTATGRHGGVGGVMIGSQEKNSMRVDTILQHACSNGVLRLANRNLTEVPREVFFLQDTDYKDKRWWEEQQLTVLDVSNNLIASIPVPTSSSVSNSAQPNSLISAFSQLRLLNASYNKLLAFPAALLVACSRTLTKLELSHNQLTGEGLPFASRMTNSSSSVVFESLVELDVSHNKLQVLCNLLLCCPRIEKLQASNNQLTLWQEDTPGAVALSLRHIDLSINNLVTLWWQADGSTLAQRCPNLIHLNASKNKITGDGIDPPARGSLLSAAAPFPSSLVTLDLKYNNLGRWPTQLFGGPSPTSSMNGGGASSLRHLREVYLGRNQLPTPPPTSLPTTETPSCLPALEMLDVSDNQIQDATFLLCLKNSLTRLDLQNNSLSTLPAELGLFPKLTNVVLEGNPLRSIRRDVIAKGTVELLAFLRDRLPPGSVADAKVTASQQVKTLEAHVIHAERQILPPAAAAAAAFLAEQHDPTRHMLGRRQQQQPPQMEGAGLSGRSSATTGGHAQRRVDDRPFATAFNANAVISEEVRTLNSACIRAGERSGTTWNLGRKSGGGGSSAGAGRPSAIMGRRAGNLVTAAGPPLSNGVGTGNSGAVASLELPEVVSYALNFAELHASTEQKFRDTVFTISMEHQSSVKALSLDFLFPFPKLRELNCSRCSSLETLLVAHPDPQTHVEPPLSCLSSLDLSHCSIAANASTDGSAFSSSSTLDAALQLLSSWNAPLARLNLSFNPRLYCVPQTLICVAKSLQYLRLEGNPNIGGPQQSLLTFHVLGQLPQLVELSLSRCNITDIPADGAEVTPLCHVDPRKGFCESSWPRLALLDLSSNELSNVPNTIGLMKHHLRQLSLEGNRIRWLRQETLSKGTVAVLQYLEDRIPR
ncbi:leucine-rich repeat protein, putative [Bodo saltans]|uniref:Leucine-rich repeat protein, putative n=1 Tax=Bodo saltans TaxID=75058 RepID=A0A0S4KNM8_BODSA|nr:leucine-rich repeat protein, putative [Bodo saltans]|eukprot:CUI15217.1 leucine-rich repeat protein, putative [Bodo saltans]